MKRNIAMLFLVGFVVAAATGTTWVHAQDGTPPVRPGVASSPAGNMAPSGAEGIQPSPVPDPTADPRAECKHCKKKKKHWKIFSGKITDLAEEDRVGIELLLIPFTIALFGAGAWLLHSGKATREARFIVQSFAFILIGIVFTQCLCNVKYLTKGAVSALDGKPLIALAQVWLPLLAVGFTIAYRKKCKNFFCQWICPLGFSQDLIAETKLHTRVTSRAARLLILVALAASLVVGVYLLRVPTWLVVSGLLLVAVLLLILALQQFHVGQERLFQKFKYGAMIFWAVINIRNVISGPWCTIAVANISFIVLMGFLGVLITSIVSPRSWCRYICPDGGLFTLLSFHKR